VSSEGTVETRERKRVWAGEILNGGLSSAILNAVWYTLSSLVVMIEKSSSTSIMPAGDDVGKLRNLPPEHQPIFRRVQS
jgi:hypothetical protein